MKVAFLLLAYKDPEQLERLINKLGSDDVHIYIHLDKKIDDRNFKYLSELNHVYFINNRIQVNWGSYRLTEATLNSMEEILNSGLNYSFIGAISGQDYPIQPVENFFSFLENNQSSNFLNYADPGDDWWEKAIERVTNYDMNAFNFKGRFVTQSVLNRLMPEKKFPLPYKMYGGPGAAFMILNAACTRFIVDFMKENKAVRRFARFSWAVDEFLFPTIIMNSEFKDSVINNVLYYTDWSMGGTHPKTLTLADFEALKKAPKFMARKFDIKIDSKVLDKLDDFCSGRAFQLS